MRIFKTRYHMHWQVLARWRFWLALAAVLIFAPPYFLWIGIGECLRRTGQWMVDVAT